MKEIIYYFKLYIKNIIFIILIISLLFLIYVQFGEIENSIFEFMRGQSFAIIGLSLMINILVVYVIGMDYEIDDYYTKNKTYSFFKKYFSAIILSTILFLLPLFAILITKPNIDYYFYKSIINFFMVWIISNILSITIGSFIAFYIKGSYKYIISLILIFIFLFPNIFLVKIVNRDPILYNLFNILDDKINSPINPMSFLLLNKSYFFDKIFTVIIILFLLLLIINKLSIKKRYLNILFLIMLVFSQVFIVNKTKELYKIKESELYEYKEADIDKRGYIVNKYNMEIDFSNILKNKCNIDIKIIGNNKDKIEFYFKDTMKIENLTINKRKIDFNHIDNKLILYNDWKKDSKYNISIDYRGFVDVQTTNLIDSSYVTNRDIVLLRDKIAWYPNPISNEEVEIFNFNIDTSSIGRLYTNLNKNKEEYIDGKYKTNLIGNADEPLILSGNYMELSHNGVNAIIPKTNKKYQEMDLDRITKNLLDIGVDYRNYKEIILLPPDYHRFTRISNSKIIMLTTMD